MKTPPTIEAFDLIASDEVFKKIKGFERYFISNYGRVFSSHTGIILKHGITNGYHKVSLSGKNRQKSMTVHGLVASHFLKDKKLKHRNIDHLDGDKSNNRVSNLEYVTSRENTIRHHKRSHKKKTCDGLAISENAIRAIRLLYPEYSSSTLAHMFNFSQVYIIRIIKRQVASETREMHDAMATLKNSDVYLNENGKVKFIGNSQYHNSKRYTQ